MSSVNIIMPMVTCSVNSSTSQVNVTEIAVQITMFVHIRGEEFLDLQNGVVLKYVR